MDVIIKTVSRIAFPLILVFGCYITLHGHLTPGGGFPGGVIIATGFVLLLIAYGSNDFGKRMSFKGLTVLKAVAGIILTALLLYLGMAYRSDLLAGQTNFALWSGGYTVFANVIGSLMVATALIIIAYRMVDK
jgi:multicomponent Na+:H+ antiporter subunit B